VSTDRRTSLLRRHAGFRWLWISRAISYVGDGIALVALVLHVQGTSGSGTAVAGLLLAAALPSLLGPVAGSIADRVDRRRMMLACELGQAVVYVTIAVFLPGYVVLLALVAVANGLARSFAPAASSSIPSLVPGEELVGANAWLGTALNLQVAFGGLLGGLLVAGVGVRWALAIDAVSFLLSALALSKVPALPPEGKVEVVSFARTIRDGLGFVATHAVARAVVITLFLGVAFAGVDNVALVFLTREELGGDEAAFGVVSSAFGFGMLAASLVLTRWERLVSARAAFLGGWFLTAAGTLATGLAPAIAAVAGAQWLGGVGNGAGNVGGDTLIQRTVPAAMRGRVFGLTSTAAFLGSGLAYAAGGVLVDLVSPRAVFVAASAGVLATSIVGVFLLPRDEAALPRVGIQRAHRGEDRADGER
jgi:MFS family permease